MESLATAGSRPIARLLWPAVACAVLTGLAIAFVDRPVATISHANFHGITGFVWLTYIPEQLFPLAAIAFIAIAAGVLAGHAPAPSAMVLLRCAVSLAAAYLVKDQLKYVFGRTWPETWVNNNPSFIGDGTFGFWPFHGGTAYASFPSGHTTAICSVAAVLWIMWPRFRWLYAAIVGLVVIGLLGADFHWTSDIIAGGFLGTAAGVTAASIGRDGGK